jgi:O-antigen/teichoic acid export membrane protein
MGSLCTARSVLSAPVPSRDGLRATTVSVTLASLASAGSLGVAAIMIARSLGPEGRGVFAASYSLVYLLMIVGSMGVGPGGRRLLSIGVEGGGATIAEYASVSRVLVAVQLPLGLVGAVVLLPIFDAGRSTGERIAFVACCVSTLASLLAREALFGLHKAKTSAIILAGGCVATLIGVGFVAASGQAGVATYLWVYALAGAGEAVIAVGVVRANSTTLRAAVRPGSFGLVLRSGRAVVILLVAQAAATRGDRLVIGAIAGPGDLGQYAVAVSVMELLSMASFSLGNVAFQGLASGSLSVHAMERARRTTLAATGVLAAALIIVAPWLIRVVFGSEFEAAVPALRVLAIASIVYGSYQIDIQHLIATGHARTAAWLAVGAAASMVVGDLLAVPVWGIEGAAWVSVGVYAGFAVVARSLIVRFHRT